MRDNQRPIIARRARAPFSTPCLLRPAAAKALAGAIAAFVATAVATVAWSAPSVDLGIGERGGYFGVGSATRTIRLTLTTSDRKPEFTCDDLASGSLYWFHCAGDKDWKLKKDFLEKELSQLTIAQGDRIYKVESMGDLVVEGETTSVLVGFTKSLRLEQPLVFRFPINDAVSTVEMKVPETFWTNYAALKSLQNEAEDRVNKADFPGAIAAYTQLLAGDNSRVFSFYREAVARRTVIFSKRLAASHDQSQAASGDLAASLEDRIAAAQKHLGVVHYVADSLMNPALGVSPGDSLADALLVIVSEERSAAEARLGTLQQDLQQRDVGWIITGNMAGPDGYRYVAMLDLLAAALTRPGVTDTLSSPPPLSAESEEALVRLNLGKSYDAVLSLFRGRLAAKQSLLPPEFLAGVRANASRLPQPYDAIFTAVDAYAGGQPLEAAPALAAALHKCTDPELCCRLDAIRMALRYGAGYQEANSLLVEAERLEKSGPKEAALERYKRAAAIAPDYVPAILALGAYHDRQADPYRANSYYTTAVARDPQCITAYERLFANYARQGTWEPAVDLLTAALKQGNDEWIIYAHLGRAGSESGQNQDAAKNLEKALEINPANYEAMVQLGVAYQNMKSLRKARDLFQRAIQLNPDKDMAVDRLKELDRLERTPRTRAAEEKPPEKAASDTAGTGS